MGDLIRRADVLNLLCNLHVDNIAVNDRRLTEHIKELPTAYDIEKVVAELMQTKSVYGRIPVSEAIDKVRKGVLE